MNQLSPRWQRYSDVFRQDVHQILAWGYKDARVSLQGDASEDEVTQALVDAMEVRMYDDPVTPEKYREYAVKDQLKVSDTGRSGKQRRTIDIGIWRTGSEATPVFTIEAKLLRKNGFPIGKYTGDGGMMLFINGDYATRCPEGAMVAYFQSDDAAYWHTQLESKFHSDAANEMRTVTPLAPSKVVNDLPHEWVSRHERPDSSSIAIFHIFLDCCI